MAKLQRHDQETSAHDFSTEQPHHHHYNTSNSNRSRFHHHQNNHNHHHSHHRHGEGGGGGGAKADDSSRDVHAPTFNEYGDSKRWKKTMELDNKVQLWTSVLGLVLFLAYSLLLMVKTYGRPGTILFGRPGAFKAEAFAQGLVHITATGTDTDWASCLTLASARYAGGSTGRLGRLEGLLFQSWLKVSKAGKQD